MTITERDVSTEEYLELLECRLGLMFAKGSFECSDDEDDGESYDETLNNTFVNEG